MDAIYDCHLHTEFSADSETPVRDQMEKAISLGIGKSVLQITMIPEASSVLMTLL